MRSRFALCCTYMLLLGTVAASPTATLTGRVTDPNGAVVVDARIEAMHVETNQKYSGYSNGEGLFQVTNLPPGMYRVFVAKQGFKVIVKPDVELRVQDVVGINFALQLGSVAESVTVEAGVSILHFDSAAVGTVIDRQFVENIPLNGRSFQTLIALSPGVVITKSNFNNQGQFSINGQRANANYFMVDGVSANVSVPAGLGLGQSGSGSLPGLSASGSTAPLVSTEAMQEFRIQTSTYAPEFGRTPGGQISIVTRSGSNDFHGSAFDYFRNDALDANDWFANRDRLARAPLRQNNFGGVLGGPIVHNRTFFFGSYEGLRLTQPQTATISVPSLETRRVASPRILPILNGFPIPNRENLADGLARFASSFSNKTDLDAASVRVDHTLNGKISLNGRFSYSPSSVAQRGGAPSLNNITNAEFQHRAVTLGSIQVISPRVNNDVRVNISTAESSSVIEIDDFGGAVPYDRSAYLPPSVPAGKAFFYAFFPGTPLLSSGPSVNNSQRQINIVDNISMIAGTHQLKFGVDYRRLSPNFRPRAYDLAVSFPSLATADALAGRASLASFRANDPLSLRFTNFSAYGQDTWKIHPRLTLTWGLRWEVNPPPSATNGKELYSVKDFDNPSNSRLGGGPLWATAYANVAPRVGAAYLLRDRAGSQTVLRGGFGVFFDLGVGAAGDLVYAFPYTRNARITNPLFPIDPALLTPPPFSLQPPLPSTYGFEPELKLPYTHQWNVSIEQTLGARQSLTLSYVAAVGRRLLRTEQINVNMNFPLVTTLRNAATSDYHSLQLQFQRRLSRGVQGIASYTWGHSIDEASSDFTFSTPTTRVPVRLDRGSSDFDIRHTLTGAVTWAPVVHVSNTALSILLRNWSADLLLTARSASPVDIAALRLSTFGYINSRPDLVSAQPLYLNDPLVAGGKRLNRAAFVAVTDPRQGTLGRNALRGFPLAQINASVGRKFPLTERLALLFRAECFNALNHPNFGDPLVTLNSPLFGMSTQMWNRSLGAGGSSGGFSPLYQVGGPRSLQLVLKLQF
ncbi:MAG: carboxypeptidase regulatory-like domain-containing protein [Bryobacteraceae bacterium]